MDPGDAFIVEEHLAVVHAEMAQLDLLIANVKAALEDDVDGDKKWIVLDNLRRIPARIGTVHLALGQLYVGVEIAEAEVAHVR